MSPRKLAVSKRVSNLVTFGVSAVVAIAVALFTWPSIAPSTGAAEPARMSLRCQEADRETAAELAAFLERNGPTDAPVLDRGSFAWRTAICATLAFRSADAFARSSSGS